MTLTEALRERLAGVVRKWSGHLSDRMLDDLVRAAQHPASPDTARIAALLHDLAIGCERKAISEHLGSAAIREECVADHEGDAAALAERMTDQHPSPDSALRPDPEPYVVPGSQAELGL